MRSDVFVMLELGQPQQSQKKTIKIHIRERNKSKKEPTTGKLSKYMKNITKGKKQNKHTCATKLAAGERHRPVLPVGYWRREHLQEKMDTITNKEKNGTLHTSYS